jgi:hypothetical protein
VHGHPNPRARLEGRGRLRPERRRHADRQEQEAQREHGRGSESACLLRQIALAGSAREREPQAAEHPLVPGPSVARLRPSAVGPTATRVTLVHAGHWSMSRMTSQTRSGGAAISVVTLAYARVRE